MANHSNDYRISKLNDGGIKIEIRPWRGWHWHQLRMYRQNGDQWSVASPGRGGFKNAFRWRLVHMPIDGFGPVQIRAAVEDRIHHGGLTEYRLDPIMVDVLVEALNKARLKLREVK